MSHELRTPLNAIIGYSELLQEEATDLGDEDYIPDLKRIHTAGRHLLTLISGILDLSKIEAGRMTMYLEHFDIATLARDTEEIVRPLVEKNGNSFEIVCPRDAGAMRADLVKARQVLFNLLSNAAKFTENGAVTMTVRVDRAAGQVEFAVKDSGIDFDKEDRFRSDVSAQVSTLAVDTVLPLIEPLCSQPLDRFVEQRHDPSGVIGLGAADPIGSFVSHSESLIRGRGGCARR